MTETESKWAERIRQWRASGKTAKEFANGQEFRSSTLRYWASELNRRTGRQVNAAAVAEATHRGGVPLVRVRRVKHPAAAEPMVVTIGGARVELRAGFDRVLLRELIDTLGVAR